MTNINLVLRYVSSLNNLSNIYVHIYLAPSIIFLAPGRIE